MRFCLAALVLILVGVARAGDTAEAFARDSMKNLKDIKPVLASIKDSKTAEAALPKLLDLGKRLEKIEQRARALAKDPEQKKRLADFDKKFSKEGEAIMADLGRELTRIRALPGVMKGLLELPVLQFIDLNSGRVARARVDLRILTQAVQAYFVANGAYPASLDQLTEKQPGGGKPFLEAKSLVDPWGRRYLYDPSTLHPTTGRPLIWSEGPRSGETPGRIRNWADPKK
jgi:hypothetical protein